MHSGRYIDEAAAAGRNLLSDARMYYKVTATRYSWACFMYMTGFRKTFGVLNWLQICYNR